MTYAIIGLSLFDIILGFLFIAKRKVPQIEFSDIREMANSIRSVTCGGLGIDCQNFKHHLKKAYSICVQKIKKGMDLYAFEKWISDNYFKILSHLNQVKKQDFSSLPHYNGVPRIVAIAEFAVSRGYDKSIQDLIDYLKTVQKSIDLDYSELSTFRYAICYCQVKRIVNIAKQCVYFETVKIKATKANELLSQNDEFLIFYYACHNIPQNMLSTLEQAQVEFKDRLIGLELSIKNSILILNESNTLSGKAILPYYSVIDKLFCKLDGYKNVSVLTRCAYMRKINYLSNKFNLSELSIAESVIYLSDATNSDISTVIFDDSLLKNYLRKGVVKTTSKHFKNNIYVTIVLLSTLILSFLPLIWVRNISVIIFCFILLFVLIKPTEYIFKRFLSHQPRLPLFACGFEVLPNDAQTVVVVSQYVNSLQKMIESLDRIAELSYNCTDNAVRYLLLVDFPAYSQKPPQENAEIIEYLQKHQLANDRICVLIRKPIQEDDRFVGYERKRGAILDLFSCILSGDFAKFDYVFGKINNPIYAILLDDDSTLLPSSVSNAVNTMLHPYNQKYDIMTYGAKINKFSITTSYSLRYSEDGSIDCYPCYNDFYSDVFDCGLYCGKGIVRIERYYNKLANYFPDKRILSHDLIEGAVLKTGSLKQSIYEDAPQNFKSEYLRNLRWSKGDLLLLPYLGLKTKNRAGENISNNIDPIYKLVLGINAVTAIRDFLLITGTFLGLISGFYWMCYVVLVVIAFPFIVDFIRRLFEIFKGIRLRYVFRDLLKIVFHFLERVFFLPFYAFSSLVNFFDTMFKSAFSKKSMLDWKPFFTTQGKGNFFEYSKLFVPSKFFISALAILTGNPYFIAYAGLYVFYAFAVYRGKTLTKKFDYEENKLVEQILKKTYAYFENCYVNNLPIDNIQHYPIVKNTVMTSPTDIGFAILSEIAAVNLKLVDERVAEAKIYAILNQVAKLKKYKGHLYNWYDVNTLQPLAPYSISGADSANFSAALYCLQSYARERGNIKLEQFAKNLNVADYNLLYDFDKGLLHISYYPNENRFEGYYDILQSEARLFYYIAIAQGLPISAWFNLSRNHVKAYGNTMLAWFGSVFEYLMPSIFLPAPRFSMQQSTERNAVKIQSANNYNGMFGISECGINQVNDDFHYKYMPNGVDSLAQRFEKSQQIYSPYSAILCLPYSNGEVKNALNEYIKHGMLTNTGFYESISQSGIVFMQMTHHQGMIMCAICNRLSNNYFCKLFLDNPQIRMAKMLLAEPFIRTKSDFESGLQCASDNNPQTILQMDKHHLQGAILVGKDYSIIYGSNGANRAIIGGVELSKFNNYELVGKTSYILPSETINPIPLYSFEHLTVSYSPEFIQVVNSNLNITETIKIIPNGKGEIRRITFNNLCDTITFYHYFDIMMCTIDEMYSHKAFFEMFIKTKIIDDCAYFTNSGGLVVGVKCLGLQSFEINTNKLNVKTRNRTLINKQFGHSYAKDGEVLYPCFAIKGEIYNKCDHANIYLIQTFGNSIQEVERALERYQFDAVDEAFDLYSFDENINKKILPSKQMLDLIGCIVFGGINAEQSKKNFLPNTTFIAVDDILDTQSLICTLKLLKGLNININITSNSKTALAQIEKLCSECGYMVKVGDFGVHAKWGESQPRAPKIKYATLKPLKLQLKGIKCAEGYLSEDSYIIQPFDGVTQKPYSNILSTPYIGCLVTDNGSAFSWLDNSREHKITLWSNDERFDKPSEDVLLWADNRLYSLTSSVGTTCVHTLTQTVFMSEFKGIKFYVYIYLGLNQKSIVKKVEITGNLSFDIKLVFGFRLALGWKPTNNIVIDKCHNGKIWTSNKENNLKLTLECASSQCFLGENNLVNTLKNQSLNVDRCDYVGFVRSVQPFEGSYTVKAFIGEKPKDDNLFEGNTNLVKIQSENISLDTLFNGWLFKQIYDCRFIARTSFYQCGGAYGFRDQLQDCLALLYSYPHCVKEHILRCAARQYEQGDVMHWWHPPKKGIRSRNSDDRLFLCYLTAKYIQRTGDKSILNRQIPFLSSATLNGDEITRFEEPTIKKKSESLLEHIKRALFSSLNFGKNNLLLVGCGDWNDGIDKIGIKGLGQSVWLTQFAYLVVTNCIDLFTGQDRVALIKSLEKLKEGINKAFVVDRFIGYITDDGEILGSKSSKYCSLYLPTQAFAVLCGAVEPQIYNICLDTAKQLIDGNNKLIKIFDKPFESANYGYIGKYPLGVRENGGQYTHAAVWFIKALFEAERVEEAYDLLCMLNPVERCKSEFESKIYCGEPYVLSADIYDGLYSGRSGWSWYTGSASWYYVTVIENLFGLKFVGGNMYFKPKFPRCMQKATLRLNLDNTLYIIKYEKCDKNELYLNGILQYNDYISPIPNKGKVFIDVYFTKETLPFDFE